MKIQKICKFCGEEFTAKRTTAQYCKPSHKTRYNRLPEDVHNAAVTALMALSRIETLLGEHPHLQPNAHQSHNAIRKYLDTFGV